MKVSKGEIFERLFVNEPELNLHIEQEAGSQVKLYVINFEISGYRNTEISNKISVEQLGEGCTTEIYALAYLRGEESVTAETHVTHAVGGGTSNQLIKFVLDDNARGRFIGDLKIAPEIVNPEEIEDLQDMVKAAFNAAVDNLDEISDAEMQKLTGGVSFPGLF